MKKIGRFGCGLLYKHPWFDGWHKQAGERSVSLAGLQSHTQQFTKQLLIAQCHLPSRKKFVKDELIPIPLLSLTDSAFCVYLNKLVQILLEVYHLKILLNLLNENCCVCDVQILQQTHVTVETFLNIHFQNILSWHMFLSKGVTYFICF